MSDFRWRTLRTRVQQKLKLTTPYAIVGDDNGNIFDATIPGNVFVRIQYANGYGRAISVRGPVGTTVQLKPGTRVKLALEDGRLCIQNYDVSGGVLGGVNIYQANNPQPASGTFIGQQSIITGLVIPQKVPDQTVAILSWPVIYNNTYYPFPGKGIEDLSSYIPASGNNCYALISVNSDFTTTTVTASTERGIDDLPLGEADVQECLTAAPALSVPLAIIRLYGGQTTITNSDIVLDIRQMINIDRAVGGLYLPLTGGTLSGVLTAPTYKLSAGVELTEASDAITITQAYHTVAAESSTTDNLATINGGSGVLFPTLQAKAGHTITVKNGTGNIFLNGGADFALSGDKSLMLFFDGTNWADIGAGGGGVSYPLSTANGGTGSNLSTSDGFLRAIGGFVTPYKWNLSGTTAPTAGDDSADGYLIGSLWFDTTNDKVYACTDNAPGAAVWKDMTGSGTGGDARPLVYNWLGL